MIFISCKYRKLIIASAFKILNVEKVEIADEDTGLAKKLEFAIWTCKYIIKAVLHQMA